MTTLLSRKPCQIVCIQVYGEYGEMCLFVNVSVCVYVCLCVSVCLCMSVCLWFFMCVYLSLFVSMFIYAYLMHVMVHRIAMHYVMM